MKQSVHNTRVICVLTTLLLLANTLLLAQAPQKMSYQAVIRDAEGELIRNSNIGMQVSILQGSADGTAMFVERHFPTTNENGLVSIEIGDGTQLTGSMEEIDWTEGPYFIQTETDLQGGANYSFSHTSELLSVPYALHSQTAKTLSEEIVEADPVFMDSPAADILQEDINHWDEAFSWGDHDGLYLANDWTPEWTDIINKPDFSAVAFSGSYEDLSDKPQGTSPGEMTYWDGEQWVDIQPGEHGQTLTFCNGVPTWGPCDDDNEEPETGTVTDIDGNVYQTVIIGEQEWMAENLRTVRYREGTNIPTGLSNADWENTTSGAYTIFDFNHENAEGINSPSEMVAAYGVLYNWYAASDARGLCPAGWHVPTDDDWTQLLEYVVSQGYSNEWNDPDGAGNALKSCRQENSPLEGDCNTSEHPRWESHDTFYGFDEFGFSALPGGARWSYGTFSFVGKNGFWWSSTQSLAGPQAWSRSLQYYGSLSRTMYGNASGFSVRCIKD